MAIPRQVWLDRSGKCLVHWSVEGVEKLHKNPVSITGEKLMSKSLLEVSGITASQVYAKRADVEVFFGLHEIENAEEIHPTKVDPRILCSEEDASNSGTIGALGLSALASEEQKEQTGIFFRMYKSPSRYIGLMCSEQSRYASSELTTDIVINVGEVKFYLHKFPLLSKSNRLQKLVSRANEEDSDEIFSNELPGGAKAFELCAKFCYGMIVALGVHNIVSARCAAEYLEMTEDVDKGNLTFKIEVFLNSSILRSWKDSIIVLQATKYLLPWSEDLNIIGRYIDSIASKTSVDPDNISWSYTYNGNLTRAHFFILVGRV